MIPILHLGVNLKIRNRIFIGNICLTPNGAHVARYNDSYMKIKNKRELIPEMTYIGKEGGFELWRKEQLDKNGEYKYVIKKIKIN